MTTTLSKVRGLNGDEAVAMAVKQANVDVIAAYPITPQTIIVETLGGYVSNGEIDAEFISVESEHSAMSSCVGAAAAGARAFTATSANGLALMHEIVYIASSLRLPIVMSVANRALSAPINIHCDHSDSMAERDSGWIQLFVEDGQEAYDTMIQAYRIAEHPDVQLPVMVLLDGFVISHTMQDIETLGDDTVTDFVGVRQLARVETHRGENVPYVLSPDSPLSIGPLDLYDYYFEHKMQQEKAIQDSPSVIRKIHDEYSSLTGREYGDGLMDPYRIADADVVAVLLGSTAGTAKTVVDDLREEGKKAGVLRIRSFRPFPHKEVVRSLRHVDSIVVLDRSASFGAQGGPLFAEMRAAFYDETDRPRISGYVYGLGGRDMPPRLIREIFNQGFSGEREEVTRFVGVRE